MYKIFCYSRIYNLFFWNMFYCNEKFYFDRILSEFGFGEIWYFIMVEYGGYMVKLEYFGKINEVVGFGVVIWVVCKVVGMWIVDVCVMVNVFI